MTTIDFINDKTSNQTGEMKKNLESKPFDAVDSKENNDSYNNDITEPNSFITDGNKTMSSHTNINNTESNITTSAISKTKDENVTLNVEEIEDQGLCFEISFLIYFDLLKLYPC